MRSYGKSIHSKRRPFKKFKQIIQIIELIIWLYLKDNSYLLQIYITFEAIINLHFYTAGYLKL